MFDFSNMFSNWDWSGMDLSNLTTPQLDNEALAALAAIAVQAAVISPAVVDTPANVAPKAAAVEKVITNVIKAVAPDDDYIQLSPFAKQITKAVVTNPAVIAAPAKQTVNTSTIQDIVAASVTKPYDDTIMLDAKNKTAATPPAKAQPTTGGTLIDGKTGRPFS
jgi:hypothetical protein